MTQEQKIALWEAIDFLYEAGQITKDIPGTEEARRLITEAADKLTREATKKQHP